MKEIFSNSWVVGILTGLASSLIFYFVSKLFSKSKLKREYLQQLKLAESEVMNILKLSISENKVPNSKVMQSIIEMVTLKYSVEKSDFSKNYFINLMIYEIMNTQFLPFSDKEQLCDLVYLNLQDKNIIENKNEPIVGYEYRNSNIVRKFNIILALYIFIFTFFLGFYYSSGDVVDFFLSKNLDIFTLLLVYISFFIAVYIFIMFKDFKFTKTSNFKLLNLVNEVNNDMKEDLRNRMIANRIRKMTKEKNNKK